jgi:hypothetical protein
MSDLCDSANGFFHRVGIPSQFSGDISAMASLLRSYLLDGHSAERSSDETQNGRC